jgi:hypothetical protein
MAYYTELSRDFSVKVGADANYTWAARTGTSSTYANTETKETLPNELKDYCTAARMKTRQYMSSSSFTALGGGGGAQFVFPGKDAQQNVKVPGGILTFVPNRNDVESLQDKKVVAYFNGLKFYDISQVFASHSFIGVTPSDKGDSSMTLSQAGFMPQGHGTVDVIDFLYDPEKKTHYSHNERLYPTFPSKKEIDNYRRILHAETDGGTCELPITMMLVPGKMVSEDHMHAADLLGVTFTYTGVTTGTDHGNAYIRVDIRSV